MEREEFYAALCKTENSLEHSAKGTTWSKKNHKYTKKIGDTYYYDTDVTALSNFIVHRYSNYHKRRDER